MPLLIDPYSPISYATGDFAECLEIVLVVCLRHYLNFKYACVTMNIYVCACCIVPLTAHKFRVYSICLKAKKICMRACVQCVRVHVSAYAGCMRSHVMHMRESLPRMTKKATHLSILMNATLATP